MNDSADLVFRPFVASFGTIMGEGVEVTMPCCGEVLRHAYRSPVDEESRMKGRSALMKWLGAAKAGHKCAVHS